MSSEFNVYVGCYIEFPKSVNWSDFANDVGIDENDFYITNKGFLIYNYQTPYDKTFADNNINVPMQIDNAFITLAQILFESKVGKVIDQMKEMYGIELTINFGAIPYYI